MEGLGAQPAQDPGALPCNGLTGAQPSLGYLLGIAAVDITGLRVATVTATAQSPAGPAATAASTLPLLTQ